MSGDNLTVMMTALSVIFGAIGGVAVSIINARTSARKEELQDLEKKIVKLEKENEKLQLKFDEQEVIIERLEAERKESKALMGQMQKEIEARDLTIKRQRIEIDHLKERVKDLERKGDADCGA